MQVIAGNLFKAQKIILILTNLLAMAEKVGSRQEVEKGSFQLENVKGKVRVGDDLSRSIYKKIDSN